MSPGPPNTSALHQVHCNSLIIQIDDLFRFALLDLTRLLQVEQETFPTFPA